MINTHARSQLRAAGIWCGPLYVLVVLGGWGFVARFLLPPPGPRTPVADVVALFQRNTTGIRIGMLCVMLAALLAIGYSAAISQAVARIEGGPGILTLASLLGGAGLMVLTFYPATFWLVAAYRPDRARDLIYLMNDLSWLQFIGGISMWLAQPLAVSIAAFLDEGPEPVLPRWAGYYNAWTVVLILPDQLLFFFQTGPFAWNGVFGLWIPVVSFGSWFLVMSYLLRRAPAGPGAVAVRTAPGTRAEPSAV